MKNGILGILLSTLLAGCSSSPLLGQVTGIVGNDLDRTVELATAYGKPEVAKCAVFLKAALSSQDGALAKIEALQKEKTSGLLSASLKAALLAELIRGLNDPAQRAQFDKDFRANCSAVAGDIMLDIARDAAKIGAKR